MSTHALVGCLLRWGCLSRARGGMENSSDQAAVKGLLRAMLGAAVASTSLAWTFFVDPEVCWNPPKLPCGSSPSHVKVDAGVMDLRDWATSRCGYRRAVVDELHRHDAWRHGLVPVSAALEVFACHLRLGEGSPDLEVVCCAVALARWVRHRGGAHDEAQG